jgi:hypothetical protein
MSTAQIRREAASSKRALSSRLLRRTDPTEQILRSERWTRKLERAMRQADEGQSISLDDYLKDPG